MISPEERDLITSLKRGHQAAIKTLFLQYHGNLCTIARKILGEEDDAKDIVQEIFIKLWSKRDELNINTSIAAYLRRATVNTALNKLAQRSRFLQIDAIAHHGQNTTEQKSDFEELSARIENAIRSLPQRTHSVFTMTRFGEMTYQEVAEALSISRKAVEKEMMKALRILREHLKDLLSICVLMDFF